MSEIRVKENESLDSALRRFKRSCARSGVLASANLLCYAYRCHNVASVFYCSEFDFVYIVWLVFGKI